MRRLALLCRDKTGAVDAIHDATIALSSVLREQDIKVDVVLRRDDGAWHTASRTWRDLPSVARDYDALVLQYNPFLYGRRGIAPWLLRDFARLRLRRRRPLLVLYVHETAMPMIGWRKTLMGLWQQLQLRALHVAADRLLVTTEAWTRQLAAMRPRRPTRHAPVASTLPDMRARPATLEGFVVATLSSGHESHLVEYVAAAAERIVRRVPDTLLILLGAGARPVPLDGVHTQRPGELPPAELASLVAAADLFLAPLVDGVSTRRTSVMTALQHEVAVVGTDGPLTDSVLRGDALELTPVGDVDAFASAAERLAVDPERRAQLAAAGRSLYERDFDWPVLARELAAILAIR